MSSKYYGESIDLMLEILEMVRPPEVDLNQSEIADIIGCRQGDVWAIERRALRKLKRKAHTVPAIAEDLALH